MKWIKDKTGRFPQRPFYEPDEIDYECESVISSFLSNKYGLVNYPISTNDLTILVEQHTSDLDLYADLSDAGTNVEGMTVFLQKEKPKVYISQQLSNNNSRENRLRTTLTHEFGHVKFHNFLWASRQISFLPENSSMLKIRCNRETILNASEIDWMEWQAGYASGAFLMPLTALRNIARQVYESVNLPPSAGSNSPIGKVLIHNVQSAFQVSEDAARIRLLKLGYLTEQVSSQLILK